MCSRGLSYDYCFCVVWYNPIMHSAVVKYKVESPDNFCMLFGDNLAKQIKKTNYASNIDIVTCTPMTKKSKRKRGYNQAYELAKVIARFLEVPVTDKILVKNRDNVSQHELTFEERLLNTKNLFGASPSVNLRGKTVLLVDDVITTGSTLNSCTKVLKARGASTVICAAVATTKLHNEKHS